MILLLLFTILYLIPTWVVASRYEHFKNKFSKSDVFNEAISEGREKLANAAFIAVFIIVVFTPLLNIWYTYKTIKARF